MRFIGIDVHQDSCTCVALGPSGRRISQAVVETTERALRNWLETIPEPRSIAFEECAQSTWLYEVLKPLADKVVVVIGKKKEGGPKDDARDARALAEDLRTGAALKRTVFKNVRGVAPLRETVRAYQLVRQSVVRTKNQLTAVFRSRGIRATDDIFEARLRAGWIRKLPAAEAIRARALGELLDGMLPTYESARLAVNKAARANRDVQRLQTLPELGPIRAATIVAIVVTPWRFRTRSQYWSYCGLGIVRSITGEWERSSQRADGWVRRKNKDKYATRGLNHNRNPWLKDVYKGAATALAAKRPEGDPLVARHKARIHSGIDPEMSLLTMARQIAEISLLMWKNEEDYDPGRLKLQPE